MQPYFSRTSDSADVEYSSRAEAKAALQAQTDPTQQLQINGTPGPFSVYVKEGAKDVADSLIVGLYGPDEMMKGFVPMSTSPGDRYWQQSLNSTEDKLTIFFPKSDDTLAEVTSRATVDISALTCSTYGVTYILYFTLDRDAGTWEVKTTAMYDKYTDDNGTEQDNPDYDEVERQDVFTDPDTYILAYFTIVDVDAVRVRRLTLATFDLRKRGTGEPYFIRLESALDEYEDTLWYWVHDPVTFYGTGGNETVTQTAPTPPALGEAISVDSIIVLEESISSAGEVTCTVKAIEGDTSAFERYTPYDGGAEPPTDPIWRHLLARIKFTNNIPRVIPVRYTPHVEDDLPCYHL